MVPFPPVAPLKAPPKSEEATPLVKNDPYKVSNAIVLEINSMAGQIFELSNALHKLLLAKPKRILKHLHQGYQKRLEEKYGENILRHVIQTSDFSFPSEDYTGQINDIVARKTREMLTLHKEMLIGPREPREVEEVKIEEEMMAAQGGKKRRRKRNLEKYAPLIFEECYVRQRSVGHVKVQNSFELQASGAKPGLSELVNPTKALEKYRGVHLFVLCHGF